MVLQDLFFEVAVIVDGCVQDFAFDLSPVLVFGVYDMGKCGSTPARKPSMEHKFTGQRHLSRDCATDHLQ